MLRNMSLPGMLRVLIADPSDGVIDYIHQRLVVEEDVLVVGIARDGEHAIQQALVLQPDVTIVEAALVEADGRHAGPVLAHRVPHTRVIVTSMSEPGEAARRAMQSAAVEFLKKPFTSDDMLAAVRRTGARRVDAHEPPRPRLRAAVHAPVPEPAFALSEEFGATSCEVFTVFSAQGGVGKSVIAVNLAVALAMSTGSRVALVDLSLQFGDIAAMLHLRSDHGIADLAVNDECSDRAAIASVLADGPEGVRVLLAPLRPELADHVTTVHVRALMDHLKRTFDYIVIDTPSHLNDITIDAIKLADEVVVPTQFSITAIKNARLALAMMDALKIDKRRVHVVANHSSSGLRAFDHLGAEGHLKHAIAVELPHDPDTVNTSINRGLPFLVANANAPISLAVRSLAADLAPAAQRTDGSAHGTGRFAPGMTLAAK